MPTGTKVMLENIGDINFMNEIKKPKVEQLKLFEEPKPDPVREKIMKQGFAPQKIDLKNLNSPIGKRNNETWLKDKSTMQDYTNKARTNYKNEWIKNNPNRDKIMSFGGDLLGEGLNHKDAKKALAARDYMFNSLKSQLGEGYDDDDIREYTHQYFNMSPERVAELENSIKPKEPEYSIDDEPGTPVVTSRLIDYARKFYTDRGVSPESVEGLILAIKRDHNAADKMKRIMKAEWERNRGK